MAVWAYRCRTCTGDGREWFVAQSAIDEMARDTRVVKVHVDGDWVCALVDRSRRDSVEGLILRDVMAAAPGDCPLYAEMQGGSQAEQTACSTPAAAPSGMAPAKPAARAPLKVEAAAISIRDARFVVVVAGLGLVTSPGEAHMAAEDLRERFGGTPVVLMAQDDTDAPVYYGDAVYVQMLEGIPLERMPWKEYTLA